VIFIATGRMIQFALLLVSTTAGIMMWIAKSTVEIGLNMRMIWSGDL
jgi:hypothetical protein